MLLHIRKRSVQLRLHWLARPCQLLLLLLLGLHACCLPLLLLPLGAGSQGVGLACASQGWGPR
jgi:hypothetical protein